MTLKELLNSVDKKAVSFKLAEYYYHEFIYPKPDCPLNVMAEKLERIIEDIASIAPVDAESDSIIAVARVRENEDDLAYRFESFKIMPREKERYDIIMTPWEQLVGLKVLNKSVELYGEDYVAAAILHDMTFFGLTNDSHEEGVADAVKKIKEAADCIGPYYSAEEVFESMRNKYGIEPPPKHTEEEERLHKERLTAMMEENAAVYDMLFSEVK